MGTAVSSGNRGVLALASSLIGLIKEECPDAEIRLFIGNGAPTTFASFTGGRIIESKVVNFRLSPRSKLHQHLITITLLSVLYRCIPIEPIRIWIKSICPWIREASQCYIVGDIRGGDSFSDIYGLKRFLTGFFPSLSILLIKGTMVHFPQTYGPFKSISARRLAAFLLRRSSVIVARDMASQKVAQDLVGERNKVILCPDVAFSLSPKTVLNIAFEPPLAGAPPQNIVGLNVNGLMYNGGYTRGNMFGLKLDYREYIRLLLVELCHQHNGEVWLIPHTYAPDGDVESDNEACRIAQQELPLEFANRVRFITGEYDQNELKWIIGLCDFFIGSRMHSCIAALSQGVPCVGVAYSMKFKGVFESVGAGDWVIDGRESGNHEAIKRVLELYQVRDAFRKPLKANAILAKEKLTAAFSRILETRNLTSK